MTEEQLLNCKQCLNRKMGITEAENICNIKGKNMNFDGVCEDFFLDKKVILDSEQKINAIKPNLKRAKIAQNLIWLVMIIDAISIFFSFYQYNLLISLQHKEFVSEQTLLLNDIIEQVIGGVYSLIFIISAITFIQWFRRAYFNLNIRTDCNYSEGWAAGCWFVPIISLYRPYQIMKEMWIKTTHLIKSKNPDYIDESTSVIGKWWFLWLVTIIVAQYLRIAYDEVNVQSYLKSTIGDIILSVLGVLLAFITIKMIKSYSLKEEQIYLLETNQ